MKLSSLFGWGICDTHTPSDIRQIKTMNVINSAFIGTLSFQLILRIYWADWHNFAMAIYLIVGMLLSNYFIVKEQSKYAATISLFAFFSITPFYAVLNQEIVIVDFILLIGAMTSTVVFRTISVKILILLISLNLFFLCNFLVSLPLFTNYLFMIGLIPPFLGLVYFYDKLETLEYEKAEVIAKLARKNQEMEDFTDIMSHDLKAPLRTIHSFTGLLQRRQAKAPDPEQAELLSFISESSLSMHKLIEELDLFTKSDRENYAFEKVDVQAMFERIKKDLHDDIERTAAIVQGTALPQLYGHEASLKIVFQNLIANGIKYQPKGSEQQPKILVSYKAEANGHCFYFEDNGIGVPEEMAEKIFEPFKRLHDSYEYKGSGLGLNICQKIVSRHQGEIHLASSSKQGSCFKLFIPNLDPAKKEA
ncbi:MAG: ATP-binding protein [Bacteroidota bacterium]